MSDSGRVLDAPRVWKSQIADEKNNQQNYDSWIFIERLAVS
jgi:hypothetical protein